MRYKLLLWDFDGTIADTLPAGVPIFNALAAKYGFRPAEDAQSLREMTLTEVFRAPTEPTQLGGYLVEPGTQLAASIALLGLDPELYPPDPLAFRPERFLDGAPEPYTWVPFGGGVRRCLGAAFAQLEMRVVIARVLARTRLRASRTGDEKARFRGVTVLPSRGGEAIVEAVG